LKDWKFHLDTSESARCLIKQTLLAMVFSLAFVSVNAFASSASDKIKDKIIQQSIDAYSGRCPCPYFADRAGRRCGRRSAYNRAGGASPLCYRTDVSDEMVKNYKGK